MFTDKIQAAQQPKLGTFLGVFTPTVLTILGVIMYLRTGWLVGHMGLTRALMIVALANVITGITALSFSAVATNTRVGVGGAYFIISRSLGLELGGAIGLPLFLSQACSVTLYSFGLAESFRIVWPGVPVQIVAFIVVIGVAALAFKGAEIALRAQVPLMILVAISLAALTVGALGHAPAGDLPTIHPSGEVEFFVGFSVFFPAVTGVMAGLGLSGDLKNPGRSIPLGAILATATGLVIYLVVPVLLTMGAPADRLRDDPLVWTEIAPGGAWLILPGLWAAIFSSAVGSMLGAPRTLQALLKDQLTSRRMARVVGGPKALFVGLIVSLGVALGTVFLGDLNRVAPVVAMFFLTVYGMVNLVTALETVSGDPSWRPKFRVPWVVSLVNGLACVAVMFLISPAASVFAIAAEVLLWLILKRRERKAGWGDARRGLYEALIRWALIKLESRPMSARNWRPHPLVFTQHPKQHLDLVRFGDWFSQRRGIVTVCRLVLGNLRETEFDLRGMRKEIQALLVQEGLVAFAEANVVPELVEGISTVAQANGMAGMESNTILLGWPKDRAMLGEFLRVMRRLESLKKSVIIGRINPRYLFPREGVERSVHVWWGGLQRNSDLMLLLAYLLTRNPAWRGAKVRVMSIASGEVAKTETETNLNKLFAEIRMDVEAHVVIKPEDKSVRQVIHEESEDAEVVFFGLASPAVGKEEEYAERLEQLAGDLGTVFFVKNSSLFVGELLQPTDQPEAPVAKDDEEEEEEKEEEV